MALRAHAPHNLHLHRLHRHRVHVSGRSPLRLSRLEPREPHRQLAEPRVSVLRRVRLLPRRAGRQHLREQSVGCQRLGGAVPFVHQHSARAAALRAGSVGYGAGELYSFCFPSFIHFPFHQCFGGGQKSCSAF